MPSPTHRLPPLDLGHGRAVLEVFLEPTCPYSKRAFEKLPALLAAIGEDRLTIKLRFVSQPWHLFSGIVTRGILAASATEGGKAAALRVMEGVYRHRDDFEFEDHSHGLNMDRTPADILREMGKFAGADLFQPFRLKSVDRALRWQVKYARQMGVHESPTFAIDHLIEPKMSSGQSIEEWKALLEPHLEG
jgi:hypothetical protein